MAQGALAYIWALDKNMIPIPGFKTVEQVKDNEFLTDTERSQITALLGKIEEQLISSTESMGLTDERQGAAEGLVKSENRLSQRREEEIADIFYNSA